MNVASGSFDSIEVAVLQKAFNSACRDLGISLSDDKSRTFVARTLISAANTGQIEPDSLILTAKSRFKLLEREEVF